MAFKANPRSHIPGYAVILREQEVQMMGQSSIDTEKREVSI